MNWINKIGLGTLVLSTLMISCGSEIQSQEGGTSVSVNLEGVERVEISRISPKAMVAVDTLLASEGPLKWTGDIESEEFYVIASDNFAISILLAPGEQLVIDGKLDQEVNEYTVTGSKGSSELKELSDLAFVSDEAVMNLNNVLQAYKDSANFAEKREEAVGIYMELMDEHKAKLIEFIESHPSSLTTIFALFQRISNQEVMKADEDYAIFEQVRNDLIEKYPNNEHVLYLDQIVNDNKAVAIGSEAPDFTLTTPEGETVSLSDFRGKVVLVDFWASWCRPCRNENPNIVEAYNTYHDRGFEVFGVSLDGLPQQQDGKAEWIAAIETDKLTWTHASDLQGWNTPLTSLYKFQGIPHSVLIDENGVIVAKNLRGEMLHRKLAEIYP